MAINKPMLLPAPGKINRWLQVVGIRPDGYHLLRTAFQFIDWCDRVEMSLPSAGHELRFEAIGMPAEPDNLALRAARLLRSSTGIRAGVSIKLHKQLPVGGGIGGGSSDAATVLVGLNHLWRCGLNTRQLAALGRLLGADVPLFVFGRGSYAEGSGEILTHRDYPESWALVATACHCDTGRVFSELDLTETAKSQKIEGRVETGYNFCEQTVVRIYSEVGSLLRWARNYGKAWLTGTGGSVIVPRANRSQAVQLLNDLPNRWSGRAVHLVNRSPLLKYLSATDNGVVSDQSKYNGA